MPRKPNTPEEIMARIGPAHPVTGCREYTGTRSHGYGVSTIRGRMVRVHRLAYELAHGPIGRGMMVCHRCDNRACAEPSHLFEGTALDNNLDRQSKGRGVYIRGSDCHWAVLTESAVVELRARYAAGEASVKELAAEIGVSERTAFSALSGESWAHVPGATRGIWHGRNISKANRKNAYRGSAHSRAKLTESSVLEIRRLYKSGVTAKEIGLRFGVSPGHAMKIGSGMQWKHLNQAEEQPR